MAAAEPLRDHGWIVDVIATTGPGDATRLAVAAAEEGAATVVACGGDGTVNEVVNGLAGTETALGVVPAGTANVWAHEAGVSADPAEALALLRRGRRVRADLGVVELAGRSRRFLLMCSFGMDAEAVRRVHEGGRAKRWFGRTAYAVVGAHTVLRYRSHPVVITVDGETRSGELLLAVAGNTRLYGGVAHLASAARIDDGLLDAVVFRGASLRDRLGMGLRALRGELHRRAGGGIEYRTGRLIEVQSAASLPVQADGEYLGETGGGPLCIRAEPAALTVLMAPRAQPLLGES